MNASFSVGTFFLSFFIYFFTFSTCYFFEHFTKNYQFREREFFMLALLLLIKNGLSTKTSVQTREFLRGYLLTIFPQSCYTIVVSFITSLNSFVAIQVVRTLVSVIFSRGVPQHPQRVKLLV
jgi:hypothetical protein